MTVGELIAAARAGDLPPTVGVEQVAQLYGVSPWTVKRRVADGTFPVAPRRLGRLLRWPTATVLHDLGLKINESTKGV